MQNLSRSVSNRLYCSFLPSGTAVLIARRNDLLIAVMKDRFFPAACSQPAIHFISQFMARNEENSGARPE
jgi:hypothetical protein